MVEKNTNESVIENSQELVRVEPAAAGQAIVSLDEQLTRELEATAEQSRRFRLLAAKLTLDNDWIQMGGRVYLQSVGAERLLAAAGLVRKIAVRPEREEREDEQGKYYLYRCVIELRDRHDRLLIEHEGMSSSRDEFFGTHTEWVDDPERKGKQKKIKHERPQYEIDETNIAKKALTNATVGGVSRLFGLRGLSRDDLKRLGRGVGASVSYDGGAEKKQETPGQNTPAKPPEVAAPDGAGRAPTSASSEVSGGFSSSPPPQSRPAGPPIGGMPEDLSALEWEEVKRLFAAHAARVAVEHNVDAYDTYLKTKSGSVLKLDQLRVLPPDGYRRAWIERALRKLVREHPASSVKTGYAGTCPTGGVMDEEPPPESASGGDEPGSFG